MGYRVWLRIRRAARDGGRRTCAQCLRPFFKAQASHQSLQTRPAQASPTARFMSATVGSPARASSRFSQSGSRSYRSNQTSCCTRSRRCPWPLRRATLTRCSSWRAGRRPGPRRGRCLGCGRGLETDQYRRLDVDLFKAQRVILVEDWAEIRRLHRARGRTRARRELLVRDRGNGD